MADLRDYHNAEYEDWEPHCATCGALVRLTVEDIHREIYQVNLYGLDYYEDAEQPLSHFHDESFNVIKENFRRRMTVACTADSTHHTGWVADDPMGTFILMKEENWASYSAG